MPAFRFFRISTQAAPPQFEYQRIDFQFPAAAAHIGALARNARSDLFIR